MAFEFREGKAIPIERLLELYQYAPWAKGRSASEVKKMLAHSDLVIGAWEKDRLVGFGRALTDRVYRAILYDVIVHPDYQGKGLGRALVEHLIGHPVLAKVPVISLFTRDKQEFYRKLGFVTNPEKELTGMILVRGGEVYRDDPMN
jgi:GNAT superfamily N-acetyltransferase